MQGGIRSPLWSIKGKKSFTPLVDKDHSKTQAIPSNKKKKHPAKGNQRQREKSAASHPNSESSRAFLLVKTVMVASSKQEEP